MSVRFATVVLAALVLAGCAEQPAPVEGNVTAANAAPIDAPAVDDGNAPMETDVGHMPHLHDYWQGKESVTLFEGDLEPDAENVTFATIFQTVFFQSPAVGGMQFFLPDGAIVYEGTGELQITASWTDPRITDMAFIYISAENDEIKEGGTLENGATFSLPVTPAMSDMPHAKSSKWWFGFGPDSNPGALAGPFYLKMDIVRVGDILLFPGHPDFWNGTQELQILDTDHHGEVPSYVKRAVQPATEGGFVEDWVVPTHIVPMETQAIRFDVEITGATSTPGEVTSFGFFYHGADTRAPFRCSIQPTESFPITLTWIVPSTMEMTDSPYATESQWQFLVEPIVTPAPGSPEMGGMTDVSYDYHVVATALQVPPEEVDDSCAVDGQ